MLGEQAVAHTDRELTVLPDLEQSLVLVRRQVVAAGVEDAGQSEAIELAEKPNGAGDFLVVGRQRKLVEQPGDCRVVAEDPARWFSVRVALEFASRWHIMIVGDLQCF